MLLVGIDTRYKVLCEKYNKLGGRFFLQNLWYTYRIDLEHSFQIERYRWKFAGLHCNSVCTRYFDVALK
jgi:hypothetical protein